jgi:hypothetical protein
MGEKDARKEETCRAHGVVARAAPCQGDCGRALCFVAVQNQVEMGLLQGVRALPSTGRWLHLQLPSNKDNNNSELRG